MMECFKMYVSLAVKDVFRLWGATQLQVIIISGICLPILILLGLKNGHVAELREELITSPVGRQVIFWSSQRGDLLSESVVEDISREITNIELIIPESQRLVFLIPASNAAGESQDDDEEDLGVESVPLTLYSTIPGDPILGQFGADVLSGNEMELVLAESLVKMYGIQIGDTVTVEIKRQLGSERQDHRLEFLVKGVLSSGREGEGDFIGYADLNVMKLLERYGTGSAIAAWNIPAMDGLAALDLYESMLLFCYKGKGTELSQNDRDFIESRGLELTEVTDPQLITLFGTLKDSAIERLKVYRLQRVDRKEGSIVGIRDTPQLLTANTEPLDDFIVRWCEPLELEINGKLHRHIGLTLPTHRQTGGWLQKEFVREDAIWFSYQEGVDNPMSVRLPSGTTLDEAESLFLQLDAETRVELNDLSDLPSGQSRESADESSHGIPAALSQKSFDAILDASAGQKVGEAGQLAENEPEGSGETGVAVAVIPVNFLAFLHQYQAGLIQFDEGGQRFTEIPSEFNYTKARLYTKTIDDVPTAVEVLVSRNYAVLSESSRIAEIHQQDSSLQMLVMVVAFGVFVFGIVTVFSVLVDSTDRKKGTIGILRVMGMTKFGVFSIVLFRALIIGFLAAILCSCVGYGVAALLGMDFSSIGFLSWLPTISVILKAQDVGLVALGAILCAAFGAVIPSLKASSLDPFEAIMEGQFH